ncbi:peptidase [Streptomyces griseocarneus]|nr:peptidase [Streptomyces griseocarneus]
MRLSRLFGRLSAVALASAVVAVGAAPAPAVAAAVSTTAEVTYTPQERTDALAYWTTARMREVSRSVDLGPTGPMTKEWKGAPVKTVGRLFFVNASGADTWCTATSVKSGNRSVVLAAAHCVRRGASPVNTNFTMVFVPGYSEKAQTPYGVFPVRATVTPSSWAEESVNDIAALTVDAVKGQRLTDVVGGQQVAFDRKSGGTVTAFGYPATRPQRGESLLYCAGTATAAPGDEWRVPCDMTGGASGGPWLADFDAKTGLGTLVSVNSHGDALDNSTAMFGPVLNTPAREVHDRAQHL